MPKYKRQGGRKGYVSGAYRLDDLRVGEGWRCVVCEKVDRWGPTWKSYGSLEMDDDGLTDGVFCSDKCADFAEPALKRK